MHAMRGTPDRTFSADSVEDHRWTLHRWVGVAIVVVMATSLAAGAVAGWYALRIRNTMDHQQRVVAPAVRDVRSLLVSLLTEQTGERAYVLAGTAPALTSFDGSRATSQRLMTDLQRALEGNVAELDQLAAVRNAEQAWSRSVAGPEIALVATARQAIRLTPARATTDQAAFDAILGHLSVLHTDITATARATTRATGAEANHTIALLAAQAGAVLVLLALLWLLLGRLVFRPLERLIVDVQTVADGQLDRPIAISGLPEMAALGQNTEAMRRRLRDESDQLRQLRQALAQRSPLHGLLRSELQSTEDKLDLSITGRLVPADGILAGDWYDAWDIGDRGVALALVDVSGHGPEAGMLALKIKHLLAPPFRMGMQPGTAVAWVSDQLADIGDQCATAIVLDVDFETGRCRYANAGHPSGLLFRHDRVDVLPRTGPLICGLDGTWETNEIQTDHGDLLVLVTDGLIEARTPDGSEFGLDRLMELVDRSGRSATPDEIAEGLVSAVREACITPLRDDATVVVVRFDSSAGLIPTANAGPTPA